MISTDYKEIIKKHLDKVALKDAVFASKYDPSDESMDECYKFIYSEAEKLAKDQRMLCLPDKVVLGWAIHFFDEKKPKGKGTLTKEQKEERFNARQLSLFEQPGYVSKF